MSQKERERPERTLAQAKNDEGEARGKNFFGVLLDSGPVGAAIGVLANEVGALSLVRLKLK